MTAFEQPSTSSGAVANGVNQQDAEERSTSSGAVVEGDTQQDADQASTSSDAVPAGDQQQYLSSYFKGTSKNFVFNNYNMWAECETEEISYFVLLLIYVYRAFVTVGRLFYKVYYYSGSEEIPSIENPILLESVISLAGKIRNKELTSVEVLEAFIARILQVNGVLNAVVDERFSAARAEAAAADALVRSGHVSAEQLERDQPFLGVPFTIKDCIMVKGMMQTAGLVRRKDFRGKDDAECIANVRAAGAIPIALTNTSEICLWWETHNHLHGRTRNAYDTTRIVGGSSGGEGCVQSVCGSAFGIGSDIGGSVRMPAFFNGIFGHKPSCCIVSSVDEFPAAENEIQAAFTSLGPMCRKAVDLKPILKIMSGENASKLRLDEDVDLSTVKLFYQKGNSNEPFIDAVDSEIQSVMMKAVEHLATTFEIKPQESNFINLQKTSEVWHAGMTGEEDAAYTLTGSSSSWNLRVEIVKNIFGQSDNTLAPLICAFIDKMAPQAGDAEHAKLMQSRDEMIRKFTELLGDNGVFFYPTHPTPAPYHNEPVLRLHNFHYTACINTLGFPATSIPMGLNRDGLPIGFQVVAARDNDRLCLAVAEELDRAFGGWVAPSADKKSQ